MRTIELFDLVRRFGPLSVRGSLVNVAVCTLLLAFSAYQFFNGEASIGTIMILVLLDSVFISLHIVSRKAASAIRGDR